MKSEYRKLLTQAYDIDKPDAPVDELAFYRAFAVASVGPVLEAMCGSGRFLIPLLAEGVDIAGTDTSEDMLRACEEKCRRRGLEVSLTKQAVERLDLVRRYGLIFCGGGSFGLIGDAADAAEAVRRMYEHLLPGGTLILEIELPKSTARGGLWGGGFWRRDDGAIITLRGVLHARSEELEEGLGIYELFVDGALEETELNEWVRRFWRPEAVRALLADAGFDDIRVTEAFSATNEPADDARIMSVIARRSS